MERQASMCICWEGRSCEVPAKSQPGITRSTGITSKHPNTTRNYQQKSRHHQQLPANVQTPPTITGKHSDFHQTFSHHQELPANNHAPLGSARKYPDTNNYQQRSKHRQGMHAEGTRKYPKASKRHFTMNHSVNSSKHLGINRQPPSNTFQPLQDLPMWTLLLG